MKKEYIIWGIPPDSKIEQILLDETFGLKTMDEALFFKGKCEELGARDVRIQVIDFSENPTDLFIKSININKYGNENNRNNG